MRSEGEDAFKVLKNLADAKLAVLASIVVPEDPSLTCLVAGIFSLGTEGFQVTGSDSAALAVKTSDIEFCDLDEAHASLPLDVIKKLDEEIGMPFATIHLLNGIQVTLNHFTKPASWR